jgi:hypothetical protein
MARRRYKTLEEIWDVNREKLVVMGEWRPRDAHADALSLQCWRHAAWPLRRESTVTFVS